MQPFLSQNPILFSSLYSFLDCSSLCLSQRVLKYEGTLGENCSSFVLRIEYTSSLAFWGGLKPPSGVLTPLRNFIVEQGFEEDSFSLHGKASPWGTLKGQQASPAVSAPCASVDWLFRRQKVSMAFRPFFI